MSAVEKILERLEGVQKNGSGWRARCPNPNHGKGRGDQTPSLSIAEGGDGRALVKCLAGCPPEIVLSEIGLTMPDLFERNGHENGKTGPVQS